MDITPGIKVLRRELQYRLREILDKAPYEVYTDPTTGERRHEKAFKDIEILSEYTKRQTDNHAIYLGVKSFNDNSTGIDDYGGLEFGRYQLAKPASTDNLGKSISWVSLDPKRYDGESSKGYYFISIMDESTFDYLKVIDQSVQLTSSYEGEPSFTLPSVPVDSSTVFLQVNNYLLIRNQDFTVNQSVITFNIPIPQGVKIKADWKIEDSRVSGLAYEAARTSEIVPGVELYFAENVLVGDELALLLFDQDVPSFHVFNSRAQYSVSLMLSMPDKKKEDELVDYLHSRINTELRSHFNRSGWTLKELSWNDDELEDWEDGGYYTVANSTINFTVDIEWARFIPLIRTYKQFIFTPTPAL